MKYVANPVIVDAFQIVKVEPMPPADPPLERNLMLDDGRIVKATVEMMARMEPKVGDYWVIQSDGYIYLNPKEVFERKYRPFNEQESTLIGNAQMGA
jgi:hypothetical protein